MKGARRRLVRPWVWLVLLLVVAIGVGSDRMLGSGSGDAGADVVTPPPATTPIKHIVVIMKENRSFDNYFGSFPGADGATTGTLSNGQTVPLGRTPDPMPQDLGHSPKDWAKAYDNGALDGFDKENGAIAKDGTDLAMTQMTESQIPAYWAYAKRYGLGDHMFSDFKGASMANNLFVFAAQAGQYSNAMGNRSVIANPVSQFGKKSPAPWGCDDPPDTFVWTIASDDSKSPMFPCFPFQAMPNVLSDNGLDWRVYRATGDQPHNALSAIAGVRYDSNLWSNIQPLSHFTSDAGAGSLPAVSWLVSAHSEHPPESACAGENETVSEVNSIMNGPDWSSTAIFIFWDEWGGFYDHVSPPQPDNISYGFRVPLLVISPYTAVGSSPDGGNVSHTFYSFESILKFIEVNWTLPSLTPRDAGANSPMDMFDFTAPPRPPLIQTQRTCPTLTQAEKQLAKTRYFD
jgi:phospholipase C